MQMSANEWTAVVLHDLGRLWGLFGAKTSNATQETGEFRCKIDLKTTGIQSNQRYYSANDQIDSEIAACLVLASSRHPQLSCSIKSPI